jgi:hypothetical protein
MKLIFQPYGVKSEKNSKPVKKVHGNKRSIKVQELFDKLPVDQQRALHNMIKAAASK